jgi:hypothetical protein
MKVAILCALALAGGLVGWRAMRPADNPQHTVDRWIDSLATGDAREFCATTTPGLRDGNFSEVGAHSGSCEARATVLVDRFQRYWEAFAGARATRSTGGAAVAEVATSDIVLPDGSRLNDWVFAMFPHPDRRIRLVHRDGSWLVDG